MIVPSHETKWYNANTKQKGCFMDTWWTESRRQVIPTAPISIGKKKVNSVDLRKTNKTNFDGVATFQQTKQRLH